MRERERGEGGERQEERLSETDRWRRSMCSREEEEEEKQSVLTEEVCMPCGPCAQVGSI